MKKTVFLFLLLAVFLLSSCDNEKKKLYLPEAKNDKVFTVVGGE